jgi:hypothetical protein
MTMIFDIAYPLLSPNLRAAAEVSDPVDAKRK